MEEEDNIIVKWAQEDVETSYSLLNNNNNNIYIYIYASECNVRQNSCSEVKNACVSNDKFHSPLIEFRKAKLENNGDKPSNHLNRKFVSQIYVY